MNPTRRALLGRTAALTSGAALSAALSRAARAQRAVADEAGGGTVVVDPAARFELSPFLFMQFMEPLGVTDSSVEAAWSYETDGWRRDFVARTRDLSPGMIRYGGLLSRHYKWREGVGPADKRPPSRSYFWGGMDTNRVGTPEFVDLCRRVEAEPMYCVNFAGDGWVNFKHTKEGDRTGDANEAADWVSYANDPDNRERRAHGRSEPYGVRYWQLGNETNYGAGGFAKDAAIEQTIAFAKAMRGRDPSLKLIGWGDVASGRKAETWAGDLVERAGEHVDYVAFHMMHQRPVRKDSILDGLRYQDDPRAAWDELMEMIPERIEKKLTLMEQALDARGSKHPLAVTEGHLSLSPRNTNPILTEWLTGVYHARAMNAYSRHGDRVKIATLADFCGNRWTVNALMIQTPGDRCWLTPAGAVARLFRRHGGTHAAAVSAAPPALDIAASQTGDKVFLHVANTDYASAVETRLAVTGRVLTGGRVLAIAPDSPREAIHEGQTNVFDPREHALPPGDVPTWRFPARSVSAVELTCRPA